MSHVGSRTAPVPKLTVTEQQSLRQVNQRTDEMAAIMAQIESQQGRNAARPQSTGVCHINISSAVSLNSLPRRACCCMVFCVIFGDRSVGQTGLSLFIVTNMNYIQPAVQCKETHAIGHSLTPLTPCNTPNTVELSTCSCIVC